MRTCAEVRDDRNLNEWLNTTVCETARRLPLTPCTVPRLHVPLTTGMPWLQVGHFKGAPGDHLGKEEIDWRNRFREFRADECWT